MKARGAKVEIDDISKAAFACTDLLNILKSSAADPEINSTRFLNPNISPNVQHQSTNKVGLRSYLSIGEPMWI